MNKKLKNIYIYTDGACRGNPGAGGWGVLLKYNDHEKELYGGEEDTTNNRMELTAAIKGLQAVKETCSITLTTDSKYVLQGVNEWIHNWKKNGWKTANKKPVKNVDLWKILDAENSSHQVSWKWVKGHTGHVENERADCLANKGIDEMENVL